MKVKKENNLWIVKFDAKEDLIIGLSILAKDNRINSGYFTGIGTLKDPILGYFEKEKKEYKKEMFKGEYELLALTGNISWYKETPIIHAHAVISGKNFLAFGGHVFSAPVAVTAEIFIHTLSSLIERKEEPLYNLKLLDI